MVYFFMGFVWFDGNLGCCWIAFTVYIVIIFDGMPVICTNRNFHSNMMRRLITAAYSSQFINKVVFEPKRHCPLSHTRCLKEQDVPPQELNIIEQINNSSARSYIHH